MSAMLFGMNSISGESNGNLRISPVVPTSVKWIQYEPPDAIFAWDAAAESQGT